jgi:hypothetical protein
MTVTTATEEDLCNLALTRLGLDVISSINEETDRAIACRSHYYDVRDLVFGLHDWNVGNAVRQLARDLDAPARPGWLYGYKKASNAKGEPLAVYEDGGSNPTSDFENAGDYVYANAATISVRYPVVQSIEIWPPLLKTLVWTALAARLAKPLTDNTDLAEQLDRIAWGAPEFDGNGGLFLKAKQADSRSQKMSSFFKNGDPLTRMRY